MEWAWDAEKEISKVPLLQKEQPGRPKIFHPAGRKRHPPGDSSSRFSTVIYFSRRAISSDWRRNGDDDPHFCVRHYSVGFTELMNPKHHA